MNDRHYANMADEVEGRSDHDIRVAYGDRVAVADMATGRAWLKFNPGKQYIYVNDAEGHPRGLTPKQYAVLTAIMDVIREGTFPTMTAIARRIDVTVSTVSRAMVKLAAWGLIGYIVGRGRYAGMVIFRRVDGDGMDRLRKVAKAKLRRLYQASAERLSRLRFNVATSIPSTTYGVSRDVTDTDNVIGATLNWTVDDLRKAGIL